MDRGPPHDYPPSMGFGGQPPPQYGYPPQQQFPPQGPPYMAPHPSALQQQYPFSRHLAPPPQSIHPLHLQQPPPAFAPPPHGPPHMVPPPHFLHPFEPGHPPPLAPPPADPELQKVIDKLVEYIAKNGPEFELMIREKQHDNPAYAFLFGGEGHGYYRYKLWLVSHQTPFGGPGYGGGLPSALNPLLGRSLSPAHLGAAAGHPGSMLAGPPAHQPFPPFYDQPHSQSYLGQARMDYDASKPFKGLSGPLPSDVAAELNTVLANLTGTKESIKGAKMWFMQRSPFAPALAEALRERVFALDDPERQLHIVFLANDILFDSLQRRLNPRDLDNEALAFKPVLGSMLARIYHNPHNREANQSHLEKLLKFWASKEVYDLETIELLETEMTGRPARFRSETPELTQPSDLGSHGLGSQSLSKWQPDNQKSFGSVTAEQETPEKAPPVSIPPSQYATPGHQQPAFSGSLPVQTSQAAVLPQPAAPTAVGEQRPPPYPLFPPGLIPGMVRKMQIGSGVPYSPLSPLDIPTVIPPSTVTPSEVLARVSKFFKEIGEVNPSEGPMKASNSFSIHDDYEHDEYERELAVRKGGACIPPPPNLHVDPETGTYPDGSVERKSGSGRLGLGATADPNEPSQYDDVYDSYRKQRSTTYHSSMSARSSAR